MSFTFPILAAIGAGLATLPIVIHLINLRRRRKVMWAAMDFLLQSDRKTRTWVRLSELLLLAARVLAIALAGVVVGGLEAKDLYAGLFGEEPTLHVVLLDDTCSMQRRAGETTAWGEATAAIERLAARAKQSDDQLVVLRYSDALTGREPTLFAKDSRTALPTSWRSTYTAPSPAPGVELVIDQLSGTDAAARKNVYLFSDFAESTHATQSDWRTSLARLADHAPENFLLAACGEPATPNLALEKLALAAGPVAAGVETRLFAHIANYSDELIEGATVTIARDGREVASVTIGPIDPHGQRRVETPLVFPGTGLHVVRAELPGDRLDADNVCWLGVETPAAHPVVLHGGETRDAEARVYAAALRPQGKTRSGWLPEHLASLDDADLADAAAVMLLDPPRLSPGSIRSLRGYLESGGGVLIVAGPQADAEQLQRLWADANAWKLGPPTSCPPTDAGVAMIRAADHPAVRVLAGEKNDFLPFVRIQVRRQLMEKSTFRTVSLRSEQQESSLLRLTNGEPLLVEAPTDSGRLLVLLTTAARGEQNAPPWSNLATLPIFPVLVNDIAGWLAEPTLRPANETIGQATAPATPRDVLQRWSPQGLQEVEGLGPAATLAANEPGVYRRVREGQEQPPFAAIVAPVESDLKAPSVNELKNRWGHLAQIAKARDLFHEEQSPASRAPLYVAVGLLLAILCVERLLAYRNSYVASAPGVTR